MGVMILKTHNVNPKYLRPKYGRGFFGGFSRVIKGGLNRMKNSSTLKKGLHNAIAAAKKTAIKTGKVAKKSLKNGALHDIAKVGLDVAGTLASEHLNKTIEKAANAVQTQIDKKLPENSALRGIADGIVQGSADIGKTLAQNALTKTKTGILNKASGGEGPLRNKAIRQRKKKPTTTKRKQTLTSKKVRKKGGKKRVNWGDYSLNSLIAAQ